MLEHVFDLRERSSTDPINSVSARKKEEDPKGHEDAELLRKFQIDVVEFSAYVNH